MNMEQERVARMLVEAQATATPISEKYRQEFTLEEAYAVQTLIRRQKE